MLKIALLFRGGAFAVGNANGTISVSNSGVFGNGNTLTDQATSSRVVGNNNYVNGQESFVLGNDVKVQKDKAGTSARVIGIGSNVTVNDNDSIAIGTGTYTEGNFVTAMGNKANASGDQAVAIGSNTVARESSTALGQQAQATGNTALAVGAVAKAEGNNSMAVGQYSQAVGASSTAVGPGALAGKNNAVALGYLAKATGGGALALGYGAQATVAGAVALGENSVTGRAVKTASATVNGITYSGFAGSNIGTSRVVSVGVADAAATDTAPAIENQQRQIQNVAAGRINATSTDAINGSQLYMVANTLGNVANTTTNILGGNATLDPNTGNITMTDIGGTDQNTINDAIKVAKTRYYSVNDGGKQSANYNNNGAKSEGALAAGVRANAIGADDVAIGSNALADSSNNVNEPAAVAVGHNAKATAAGAIAVGDSAEALSTNVVSMGYSAGSGSNAENSIWIGANSGNSATGSSNIGIGDGAGNGIGETNPYSNYNVAMGVYAGGGLNGSNNLSLGISAGNTLNGNDNVTLGNAAGANLNGNNNIAIGRQAGTAVVVNSDPNNPIFESGDSDTREVNDSISLGNNAQALKDNAIAIGLNAQAKNENDVALGAGAITEAAVRTTQATVNKITYNGFAGTSPIATLSVGSAGKERTITNVAAGRINKDSTDAINGSQLYVIAGQLSNAISNITNDGVKYAGDIGNAAIKLNQTATIVGGVKDKSNLTDNNIGVVASQDGDDAKLTVKLAKNLNLGPDGSITISNSSNDSSSVRLNKGGLDNGGNKIINVADGDISQNSKDAVNGGQLYNTIQQTVKAVKIEVKEGDNIVITSDVGSDGQTIYTVSTVKDVKFDSAKIGNKVTINNNGIDAGDTKVTGVKAGDVSKDSTDAVNGSQLHETNQKVAKNATNIANNTAAIKKGLNFTADDGKTLNRQLGDTVAVNGDENVIASVTSSGVKVALNKKLKVDSVTAGNTVVNNDGVIIGTGDKAVSLTQNGLNNGGNRITNVAPGKDPTDAVNVAQLSNVTNHLDNKVNKVASDMKHMDKKLRAGIAGAAALGVLAQPTRPGKSMVSVGGTTYRDESAVALGVSRVSDNEKWVIKIGASANTRNNYIAGGSVGYQW
ncbi:YadA-like family protein [Avibacterium avium]|uniref:YadA-like family protein n=1 Tax=Avibacterium avium TaxID=751 RepID=UPI003BF807A0